MKIRFILTTLLTFALAVSANAALNTAKVTVSAETEVLPGDVTVKDIACIQAPKGLAAKIGEVSVAQAPQPGQNRTLNASYIKQRIAMALPKSVINVVSPDRVRITGKCTKVTPAELEDAAKQFAENSLPKDDGREYEVSVNPVAREIIAPGGEEINLEPEMMSDSLHAGLNPLRMRVKSGDSLVTTAYVSVKVKITASVLVALDSLTKGDELNAQNISWEKRDISKCPKAVVDRGESTYQGYVAKKSITSGYVITADDITLPPAIKQGDTINLVVRCGGVVLQTSAEAKQTGAVGDMIRVTSPVSSGDVRAKVIEPGLAEIRM